MKAHHVDAVHGQLTAGGVDHPVDRADQGGFARAAQADDGHELPLLDGEVDILEALHAVGIYFVHMLELDQWYPLLCMAERARGPEAAVLWIIQRGLITKTARQPKDAGQRFSQIYFTTLRA